MAGRSTGLKPLPIPSSSRRSAHNCIDARASLVVYIQTVGLLCSLRGNQIGFEQMTMTATDAAHGRCYSRGRILEVVWHGNTFPRSRVENRTDSTAERGVLAPQLHLQAASAAIKEDRAFEPWPLAIARFCQLVPGNEQIVRPLYPEHFHPDQYWCDHDRVYAVYTNAVHGLKPGQRVALFIHEARIRAHLRDRAA